MYQNELPLIRDPVLFAERRLGFKADQWQAEALRSSELKLLLNCARQTGKSTVAAILALLEALCHQNALVILLARSLRQSMELALKVRCFLDAFQKSIFSAYGNVYLELSEDNKATFKLFNDSRVVSLPENPDTIRGFSHVNLICVDEASRVPDDTYYTLRPMLAVSRGRLILLSTPFGKRGFFFQEFQNPAFRKWTITANQCPRISKEFLELERGELGEWWFRQEYLCEFVDLTTSMFSLDRIMQSLDTNEKPLNLWGTS